MIEQPLRVASFSYSVKNDCCKTLRQTYPLRALASQGKIELKEDMMTLINTYINKPGAIEYIAKTTDVIIFHRPTSMHSNIYLFYESLKKVNPKLVFITEVDDILFNDSKENNRFLMEFYLLMPVIVSNGYIANYLFNIIPHIKLYLFQTKLLALEEYPKYKPPKNPVILHAGTNTHSKDLSLIVEPLKNVLLNHPNTKVCFWGNGTPLELEKYHNQTSRKQYTSDYEIYTQAFLQFEATFSINPLIVSRINTGKSAIKYLEAAQKGLPALFSPIPEYLDNVPISELIVKDEEWENKMEWMLSLTKKQLKEISNTMRNDFLNKWVFTQQDIEDYYNILIESKNLTFGA